jgi:hypothetical protein
MSVVVIQQFVESVTCLILCYIRRKKFGCVPFVKRMIQLSLRLTSRQDVILYLICAICAAPWRSCFNLRVLESCGICVIWYLFCFISFLLFRSAISAVLQASLVALCAFRFVYVTSFLYYTDNVLSDTKTRFNP